MKTPRLVPLATILAALILALTLAACGEKSEDSSGETEPLSLALDFYPNPDHAGIYMAQERGYFGDAGLDVSIEAPTDPSLPIKQVAAGKTDLAISYEPEVILAREAGLDVVAIGALVNVPLTSMIWLEDSGVVGIPSLKGKTIAYAGIPYQEAFLETILARGGLTTADVKAVNVGFNLLPALVGGSADAMLGGFLNIEGVDLRERGLKPVITPVDQLGVPTYDELVLVASPETLEAEPEKFRLFLAALERGTDAAVAQPNAATEAILTANPALEPKLTKAEVEATLPLLGARVEGQPYGFMDPAAWDEFAGWMRDNELIKQLPTAAELLSNDYLPGKIPE
jgi:putative hydroxymethylpyrimidine transport system substrate-binding protein